MKSRIIISCLIFFQVFGYSQTRLSSSISKKVIKYGEPVTLKLEVKAGKNDKVIFPAIKDTLTYHLELLEDKKDTLIKDEIYTHTDSITFSAYEPGTFIVPSQKILINSKEYFSPEYKLTVDFMVVDSIKQPLYDIYPIAEEPKVFKDYFDQYWVYMLMGLIILLVVIILIILYYLEIKKKKLHGTITSNPDKIALKKLTKLEKSNYLSKGMSKKYYSEMVLILKEYMEKRWDFSATKLFSDDLIDYLGKNYKIKEEQENELKTIFISADLAKFAKSTPSVEETKQHTEMVKRFINETKTEFLNYRESHEH